MANESTKHQAIALRLATLTCACLLSSAIAQATSCAVDIVTLARVQGRVRYEAEPNQPLRAGAGIRVKMTTMVARQPKVIATVDTDEEGRFAFKTPKAGRPYVLSFKGADAFGIVNIQIDSSSPHAWLTTDLYPMSKSGCPVTRTTVGQPD